MESYYDSQEKVDITLLENFNKQLNWFNPDITATTKGTSHDAEAIDIKKRKTIIELKERKGNLHTYKDIYKTVLIEPKKIAHMSKLQEVSGFTNNEQRLYINFIDDAVIIFDMNKPHTLQYYPNKHIYDPGQRKYVDEDRFGIPVDEAIIYIKDYKGNYTLWS